jgi:hypothetical protein
MVAPLWFRVRIGPYLRRERDKRAYHRLFHGGGAITGVRRLLALATLPRIPEAEARAAPEGRRGVVLFRGMGRLFEDLRGHSESIRAELLRITRPGLLPGPRASPFIAVHVRLGDFSLPSSVDVLTRGNHNYRIPVEWYVEALRAVRADVGSCWPAVLFSDGADAELAPILSEPAIERARGSTAITDLIDMAGARALVASGSTFSMWASFLGQIPTVWYPGQRRQFVLGSADARGLEPEWDVGGLPKEFREAVSSGIRAVGGSV